MVSEAQEPDQILWINQQEHDGHKRYRRCFLFLILAFFVSGTIAGNFFLILKQRQYEKEGNISELIQNRCSDEQSWNTLAEYKSHALSNYLDLKK